MTGWHDSPDLYRADVTPDPLPDDPDSLKRLLMAKTTELEAVPMTSA